MTFKEKNYYYAKVDYILDHFRNESFIFKFYKKKLDDDSVFKLKLPYQEFSASLNGSDTLEMDELELNYSTVVHGRGVKDVVKQFVFNHLQPLLEKKDFEVIRKLFKF